MAEPPLERKRVAVVSGHFSPEVGYQEVDLARAFTRLGADVRVVTSTRPSRNARSVVRTNYASGLTPVDGYEVVRLEPRLTIGTNVLGCKVVPWLHGFGPDHAVVVGPAKLFGLDVFSADDAPWTRIAIVQDNSDDGRTSDSVATRWLRAGGYLAVKRRAYRRVVRYADRVVLNVPETRAIVASSLDEHGRARLAETGLELRLGFDPTRFRFDEDGRHRWRARHGVAVDEVVLVTCTRATREKRLEDLVRTVSNVRKRGIRVRYVLAGVLDDEYGRRLRILAAAETDQSAFVLLPMLEPDEMRALFSASDIGYWPRVAITIQQAMGTGLPVVLRHSPNVGHLLVDGENGWYVQPEESADDVIAASIEDVARMTPEQRVARREVTALRNSEYLSYDRIALAILNGLRPGRPKGDAPRATR